MKKEKITRQELYELIWSYPITTLTNKLEITYHQLNKMCKEMMIPLPQAGHWQKTNCGKSVRRINLPTNYTAKSCGPT